MNEITKKIFNLFCVTDTYSNFKKKKETSEMNIQIMNVNFLFRNANYIFYIFLNWSHPIFQSHATAADFIYTRSV